MNEDTTGRPASKTTRLVRKGRHFATRDRILLYLSDMDIGGRSSLELASECLRRAGDDAPLEKTMEVLRDLLQEKGVAFRLAGVAGERLRSHPPINRKAMISEGVQTLTLYGTAKRFILRALGVETLREKLWKKRA